MLLLHKHWPIPMCPCSWIKCGCYLTQQWQFLSVWSYDCRFSFSITTFFPFFPILSLCKFPSTSQLFFLHSSYKPGRVKPSMFHLRLMKPAKYLFSNCCSCYIIGQLNTLREKQYTETYFLYRIETLYSTLLVSWHNLYSNLSNVIICLFKCEKQ